MKRSSTRRKPSGNNYSTPVIDLDSLEVDLILNRAAHKAWKQNGEYRARKNAEGRIAMLLDRAPLERWERAMLWIKARGADLAGLRRIETHLNDLMPKPDTTPPAVLEWLKKNPL